MNQLTLTRRQMIGAATAAPTLLSAAQRTLKRRRRLPMLAGSPIPVTWRLPDAGIPFGTEVQEAVAVGFGRYDHTDRHALEGDAMHDRAPQGRRIRRTACGTARRRRCLEGRRDQRIEAIMFRLSP